MDERRESLTLTLVFVAITSALSYVAGAIGLIPWVNQQVAHLTAGEAKPPAVVEKVNGLDVQRLSEVVQAIEQSYVEEVDPAKLTEGSLKGMVEALGDRHSAFYTAEEYKEFFTHIMEGVSFSGIGVHVEMSEKTGLPTVLRPIKDSPGAKAGLRMGDAIIRVNDKDVTGMDLNEAVALIRGPEGTSVKLTIHREGEPKPLEFTIVRTTIKMPSLEYQMLDKTSGTGYVQFYEFTKGTAQQLQSALQDLRAQGMTRLILDLRQNPGGLLNEAVDVVSLFAPKGQPVVHIVERGQEKQTIPSKGLETFDLPLIVLVDGGSASASEITAGAVKDLKLGVLMGTKTFGKGSVQTFWDFPDGSGIKLTTAKYLTAGEKAINEIGIDPDIVVENPDRITPGAAGDPQLEAALEQIETMTR